VGSAHKEKAMTTATDKLQNRDYTIVIDRSGSMSTSDTHNGKTRWEAAQESTFALAAKVEKYDPDGLTLYTFNDRFKKTEGVTSARVNEVFAESDPAGGTTLAPVLQDVFNAYLARKKAGTTKPNGEICLVITDGQPSDEAAVASAISNFTKKLDNREEFGISFIQVGKDAHAAQFLKKLDDELTSQGAKLDIVDTVTMDEIGDRPINDVLMGALTD
jgi:uncharacterized protein YegL